MAMLEKAVIHLISMRNKSVCCACQYLAYNWIGGNTHAITHTWPHLQVGANADVKYSVICMHYFFFFFFFCFNGYRFDVFAIKA